jgi:hypothetical protein
VGSSGFEMAIKRIEVFVLVERIGGLERARERKTKGWMKGGTVVN